MNLLKKLAEEYGDKLPLNGKDGLGNTALHYACFGQHLGKSFFFLHIHRIQCLIFSLIPFRFFIETDAVEFLVKLGAGLNEQNLAGDTPLHKAVEKNSISIVQFLLKKGAVPDVKNKKGQTPITHSKSTEMRKILKERTHEIELNSIGISTAPSGDADNDMVCGDDDDAEDDD